MAGRQVALYFAWSRPDEVAAPLGILEDRFPALFELRRTRWPQFEKFADPVEFDQGVGGSLDTIQLANYKLGRRPRGRMDRKSHAARRTPNGSGSACSRRGIPRRCRYARRHQFRLRRGRSSGRAMRKSVRSGRFSMIRTTRSSYVPITTSVIRAALPRERTAGAAGTRIPSPWRSRHSGAAGLQRLRISLLEGPGPAGAGTASACGPQNCRMVRPRRCESSRNAIGPD